MTNSLLSGPLVPSLLPPLAIQENTAPVGGCNAPQSFDANRCKKTEGEKKDALHSVFVALYVINVTERFG